MLRSAQHALAENNREISDELIRIPPELLASDGSDSELEGETNPVSGEEDGTGAYGASNTLPGSLGVMVSVYFINHCKTNTLFNTVWTNIIGCQYES